MNQIHKTNIRRIADVLVAVCVALTISASLVAGETAAVETERTGDQVDRTNKADSLRIPRKPVERDGAKQIEAPRSSAAPRMLA